MKTRTAVLGLTLGLGAVLSLAGIGQGPAAQAAKPAAKKPAAKKPAAKPAAGGAALVAKGKALAESKKCNTCHSADYAGKQGFSPSLKSTGALKEYNPTTWARVMNTGVTEDGGHVKPPMPVYHLKKADSDALWAYFKTLK